MFRMREKVSTFEIFETESSKSKFLGHLFIIVKYFIWSHFDLEKFPLIFSDEDFKLIHQGGIPLEFS